MEYWCKMKYANVVSLFITFNKYLPSGKGYCDFYLFIFSYVNATCLVRKILQLLRLRVMQKTLQLSIKSHGLK